MLKLINRVIYRGFYLLRGLAALCLLTIVISITAGIISRKIFNSPFTWTEELCTILFIWLSFLGAAVVCAKRGHVAVDFITDKFTPRLQKYVHIVINILTIILLGLMFVGSIMLMPTMTHKTVALQIPRYWNYVPIFIGSLYMLLVYIEDIIKCIKPELYSGDGFMTPQ